MNEETEQTNPEPHITRITVGRLFNLGSYEHIRYELAIDVPYGESAAKTLIGIERLLNALNPRKLQCCKSELDLKRDEVRLMEAVKMGEEEWQRHYGNHTGTRGEILERLRKSLEEDRAKRETTIAQAKRARELLDNLGGAAVWTDHKLDWEDEDDQY